MATSFTDIPLMSPLKFRRRGYANPGVYNNKHFDNFNYPESAFRFDSKPNWRQPWQHNDIIPVQILSNNPTHSLRLVDCRGVQVASFVVQYVPTSVEARGFKVYEAFIALDALDLPDGLYQFIDYVGSPSVVDTLESEVFELKAKHIGSTLLEYRHDENDHGVVFETGITFRLRFPGRLAQFKPSTDRVVYEDEPRNLVTLSAKAKRGWKLFAGSTMGVPDWFADRFAQASLCSYITADGVRIVVPEGAEFEEQRQPDYALTGWAIDVREKDARNTKRWETAPGEDGIISSIMYGVEGTAFGPINGPAADNTIQVISVNDE